MSNSGRRGPQPQGFLHNWPKKKKLTPPSDFGHGTSIWGPGMSIWRVISCRFGRPGGRFIGPRTIFLPRNSSKNSHFYEFCRLFTSFAAYNYHHFRQNIIIFIKISSFLIKNDSFSSTFWHFRPKIDFWPKKSSLFTRF